MLRQLAPLALVLGLLAATPTADAQSFYYSVPGFRMRVDGPPVFVPPFVEPPAFFRWSVGPEGAEAEMSSQLPPAPPLEDLNYSGLRGELIARARHYENQLARLSTGDTWVSYFELNALRQVAASGSEAPSAEEQAKLRDVLAKFHSAAENNDYRAVTGLDGFAATERALAEFAKSPIDRQLRALLASSAQLDASLDRLSTGQGWKQHLALPAGISSSNPGDNDGLVPALNETLSRFDKVSQTPEYRQIAQLPGFDRTRNDLAAFLVSIDSAPRANTVDGPPVAAPDLTPPPEAAAEELPPPAGE